LGKSAFLERGYLVSAILFVVFSSAATAGKPRVYSSLLGGAIGGYDPVAYFFQGKPVPGSSDYALEYQGATWKFSSPENKLAFEREPEKYAPQYGGYCAYAVAHGSTASIDPEAWTVVGGKLYLNNSKAIQNRWSQDIPGNIDKANANWPGVLGPE